LDQLLDFIGDDAEAAYEHWVNLIYVLAHYGWTAGELIDDIKDHVAIHLSNMKVG
jgi:hypothetical protein